MKKILFASSIFLLSYQFSFGQYDKVEFLLEPVGSVPFVINSRSKLFNDIGINYQHCVFSKTYVVLGVQGNFKNYNDECQDCPNNYAGKLANRKLLTSLGVRYLFLEEVVETWNIFAEANFYYLGINANGILQHNTTEVDLFTYNKYNGVGLGFKLGTVYQFNSPCYVGANVGIYLGGGKAKSFSANYEALENTIEDLQIIKNKGLYNAVLELRAGFSF